MLGPLEQYVTPTLNAAMLCSSRAGSDLGCIITENRHRRASGPVQLKNTDSVTSIDVTSFSSISYYSNVRLISKIELLLFNRNKHLNKKFNSRLDCFSFGQQIDLENQVQDAVSCLVNDLYEVLNFIRNIDILDWLATI